MLRIWYHGTNAKAAAAILKTGFRYDSWFAAHLEAALDLGGRHVFQVALPIRFREGQWQIHVLREIPPSHIVAYTVYTRKRLFENVALRRKVFESNEPAT